MKIIRYFSVFLVFLFNVDAFSISMNYTGHMRTQASVFTKLNQEMVNTAASKQFIESRILLEPNLVIDDHFSLKSQWNLLTSPRLTPDATTQLGNGQGGYVFGDPNSQGLILNRAWLDWTSDFGVVRIGRMPVSWGYGLVYDAGNNLWDNWQTTFDRLEYRLHLGHVVGAVSYTKPRKLSVEGNSADSEFYGIYLRYDNPEQDVEGGILYEKQVRADGLEGDYLGLNTSAAPGGNPYRLHSTNANPYPLSTKTPYPRSNNLLDLYIKKNFGYFSVGGEAGWITGDAFDYNQNFVKDELNAFGLVANIAFEYHKIKFFNEFVFASGDSNLSDTLRGFVLLHRNKSPGFIFGKELIGQYASNSVGIASPVVYSPTGGFTGVYYLRPGFRVDWSSTWASGLEIIWARKASTQPGEDSHLATEFDLGTDYSLYKNLDLGFSLGFCFPGKGIPVPVGIDQKMVFGFRTSASLRF